MAIHFVDESGTVKSNTIFNFVDTILSDEERYFAFKDEHNNEVKVQYPHVFFSEWDDSRFELYLFENSYLTAENDIFQLSESNSLTSRRLGWLFPITALESTYHNYVENSSFKNYRTVSYKLLLSKKIEIALHGMKNSYSISELFPNLIICVLSKEEIITIPKFKIENYILSFLKYDYLLYNGNKSAKPIYDKSNEINSLRRGNHKIKLKKSAFDILKYNYTKALFLDHQLQNEYALIRFIFLYQIFEQLIQEKGDLILEEIIENYKNNNISKNTLKEQIAKSSNDRTLLGKVLGQTNIPSKNNFVDLYQTLCINIGEQTTNNFTNAIYNFRNLITHRYRDVNNRTKEVSDLIQQLEVSVIEFLINYNLDSLVQEIPDNTLLTIEAIGQRKISLWKKIIKVIYLHLKNKNEI